MILRDCLVRWGIVTSKRVLSLPPAAQLFFRNLLHVCDGAGRFEADADILRSVLYGLILHKIQRGDVARWLADCHRVGLVKLYTVAGRGYGRVINYGQRDFGRKVLYPDEESDQLALAGFPADVSAAARAAEGKGLKSPESDVAPPYAYDSGGAVLEVNRKERRGRKRARGATVPSPPRIVETAEQALARLRQQWPHVDLDKQLSLALANRRKAGKELDLVWFEEHWLSKCGPAYQPPSKAVSAGAPRGWLPWLRERYGHMEWVRALADDVSFEELSLTQREVIVQEMKQSA